MDKPKFWDLWWFQMGSNTARTQNQRGFQGIWDLVSLDKCCDFITSWNSTDSPNPQKIRTGFSWRFSLSPHQGQSCKSMGFMECWVLVSDGRLKPAVFWLLAGFSLKNISNIFKHFSGKLCLGLTALTGRNGGISSRCGAFSSFYPSFFPPFFSRWIKEFKFILFIIFLFYCVVLYYFI